MQPGDQIHRAEARANMSRPGLHDHGKRVQPARVGESCAAFGGGGLEAAQARQLARRNVGELHCAAGSPKWNGVCATSGTVPLPLASMCSASHHSSMLLM